jgi:hypothetical protein
MPSFLMSIPSRFATVLPSHPFVWPLLRRDDLATHHHRNPRRGSQVVMGGSIMGSAISAVGPGMASSISAAGPGMGSMISSAGNAHNYAATPRNAAAGNGSHSGSAVNLGEAGGIFLGGRRNG